MLRLWFGFDFGLGWFFGGFELILNWVSQWVWIVFELDFSMSFDWFWVGFSGQLILGQLCGGLSTVQMICVGVGWVVVVVVVLLDWWLSSASSFFFLCFVGLLWTLEWSSLIEERLKKKIIIHHYRTRAYLHCYYSKCANMHIFTSTDVGSFGEKLYKFCHFFLSQLYYNSNYILLLLWSVLLIYTLNYFKKILLGFIKVVKFFDNFFNSR